LQCGHPRFQMSDPLPDVRRLGGSDQFQGVPVERDRAPGPIVAFYLVRPTAEILCEWWVDVPSVSCRRPSGRRPAEGQVRPGGRTIPAVRAGAGRPYSLLRGPGPLVNNRCVKSSRKGPARLLPQGDGRPPPDGLVTPPLPRPGRTPPEAGRSP